MGIVHAERIRQLRDEMTIRGLDAALVFTADEHGSEYIDGYYAFREYLSGFTGSAGSMLVTMDEAGLWTDGRYFLQAESELEGSGINLHRMGETGVKSLKEYLDGLIEKCRKNGRDVKIGIDLRLMSACAYKKLKESCGPKCQICDTDLASLVWKDRPEKTINPVYELPFEKTGRQRSEKIADIRKRLKDFKADGVIISDLSDVMWVFNIRGSDIQYNPVAVSYGFIDGSDAYLFIDPSAADGILKDSLTEDGVNIKDYKDFDLFLGGLGGKILCDDRTLNAHLLQFLKSEDLIFVRSFEYIRKHIKNETECLLARNWHVEDGLILTRFIYKIKKMVSDGHSINEYEAAMMLDSMRNETKGCFGISFDTISAYGSNGAVIHYSPSEKESSGLKPSGFFLLDSGGHYEGATTDVTRTIALGDLTDEMKKDYTSVLKGLLDLSDAVFLEGTRGENLDILARRPIWERCIDYRHGTGHGVGAMLNVHEGPQGFRYRINNDSPQPPLEPGMITSDEPGIYLEGKYGIRIENLLLCTEKKVNEWGRFLGFDTLTMVPYERDAILTEMLTKRQKEILNSYHKKIFELYEKRMDDDERRWLDLVTAEL